MFAHAGHSSGGDWSTAAPGLLLAGLLASGYLAATARDQRGWSRWRTASWLAGCLVIAVAVAPLLGSTADPVPHMARHLLLGMFAPLGLVMGAPVTLLLRVAPPPVRGRVARLLRSRPVRLLAHPMTAAVLTTGGLALVLLTPLYAAIGHHPLPHHALHLHYLAAGFLFAWAVAGPDPAPHRPGLTMRAAALVVAAAGHAVLAKYLYANADTLPPGAGYDAGAVRAAAQLMYYGGDLAELLLAVALFADWYLRRARRRAARGCRSAHDALTDAGV